MAVASISEFTTPDAAAWLHKRPIVSQEMLALLASLFFTLFCNLEFWHSLTAELQVRWRLLASVFVIVTALHAFLLGLVVTRRTAKPLLAVLFIITAFAAYYMNAYTVYLDPDMIRNVLHTDPKEAGELLVPGLALPLLCLAALPIMALWRIRLRKHDWKRALWRRLAFLIGMLLLCAVAAMLSFKDLSALVRNQREVRYLVTPANYVVSLSRVLLASPPGPAEPLIPIGEDAKQLQRGSGAKPRLLIFVLGETARARNWELNGYARQTTPQLAAMSDVINFARTSACGTSTEVSVPCLFSPYGRHDYDEGEIRSHQSLLHILQRAGVDILWRDNQSGCKHVCDGLAFESLSDAGDPLLCNQQRCFDEILLSGLRARIKPNGRDQVVVLHQLGNHGPAYYQRYPPEFRRFVPTCDTEEIGKCTRQQIVNSYDNALLYTDHFLAQTIAFLRQEQDYDTAMIYVSDHGESLGENGLFLHGMPYAIAPREQTHVPMLMWFSPDFAESQQLDLACLRREAVQATSHDNLFPSILGLMQVRTQVYTPERDLFARCHDQGVELQ